MPTTPNGTNYTLHESTPPGGHQTLLGVPDDQMGATGVPLVLYLHGNGGAYNQFSTYLWNGLRNWMVDRGWAWVEGQGGDSSASWGNQSSRDSYEAAFGYAQSMIDVGPVVVLGRSMGALAAYWLATQSPVVSPHVAGLIVNSGTTDLVKRYELAITAGTDRTSMNNAYGLVWNSTDMSAFRAVADPYDPMQVDPAVWTGKRVLQMYGTADTSVPAEDHALPWVTKYGGHASVTVDVRQGGDHSPGNGSYLQVDAMTAFLQEVTAAPTIPPVTPPTGVVYHRVTGMYVAGPWPRLYPLVPSE